MAVKARPQSWLVRKTIGKGLRPRHAAYLIVTFWLAAIIVFAIVERVSDPKTFPTIWLAFWWAVQTVTTVGYGDVVPTQATGKVAAAFLMLGGLSLLSIITATITSAFVARRQADARAAGEDPVMHELVQIARRLDSLESELRAARRQRATPALPAPDASTPGAKEATDPRLDSS